MPDAEKYNRLRGEKLPPLHEVAARIKAGESHAAVAEELGLQPSALAHRLLNGGYRWETGESETEARRRELKEYLRTRLLTHQEPWMDDALCKQVDPELWFPEKGQTAAEAKAVCALCSVKAECLQYSLKNRERFGVWGAVAERDRRKMLNGDAA